MGGPEQPFGLSACAFQVGYASLALLFFLLKIPQHYGSSRVPAEIKDKEEDAEVEAEEMVQCSEQAPFASTPLQSLFVPSPFW